MSTNVFTSLDIIYASIPYVVLYRDTENSSTRFWMQVANIGENNPIKQVWTVRE